jgi:transcriptional adapter 2-alpha
VAPSTAAKTDGVDGDKGSAGDAVPAEAAAVDPKTTPSHQHQMEELVLTSEKRRGVYECDYCHSDISQLPRIRCAICPDFDLCLDCFATTDHSSAIARLKAAATAHSELAADGIASTMVTGLSCATHDDTHGYRVCDSTRYPLSGSARNVIKLPSVSLGQDEESNDEKAEYRMILNDDPKSIWTAEEDLRLLDAIKTHGLGNWIDIADAIGGNGSTGKIPKRCMERYFDCFLGRYGHVLPEFTIVEENPNDDDMISNFPESNDGEIMDDDDESVRSSKRRQLTRPPSNVSASSGGGRARKRYKVVPTESLPGYKEWWPEPYLPPVPNVEMGQEVARDLSQKNELEFVKLTSAAASKEEVDKIRKEWEEKCRTQKIGAPTVLPPLSEDSETLPGAELVGFMPRRGDLDIEHENDAEVAIAEMEFLETDTEQEKQLKVKVLQIYYQKQNERETRKQFILSRKLYDYREYVKNEQELPRDERDLRHRMRLFERFHTPDEHQQFIDDIIKAKRLRKEIAKLQMYRRIGIRSLAEAEKYELDKSRRQFHKAAQLQKETEAKQAAAANLAAGSTSVSAVTPGVAIATTPGTGGSDVSESLWKNYRKGERKGRRSINRTSSGVSSTATSDSREGASPITTKDDEPTPKACKPAEVSSDAMDVDSNELKVAASDAVYKTNEADGTNEFNISSSPGYDLLSRREVELCVDLAIYPLQYLEIKKALIQESLKKGLLENEGPGSSRRMVVKMDVKRRGEVIDFILRAGWISPKLANVARTVTPPPATTRIE